MNLLYALIAFSIIMIVSSTLVVALVRLLHEFRGMRQRHMRYLLGAFFDEYLWPQFGKIVSDMPPKLLRTGQTEKTATEEVDPKRSFKHSLFAALDLWTIFWRYIDKDDTMPARHSWGSAFPFAVVAIWVAIIVVTVSLVSADLGVVAVALFVLLFFGIDYAREVDRERFAIWSSMDSQTAADLKTLEKIKSEAGNQPMTPANLLEFDEFKTKSPDDLATLLDQYERLKRRRAFINEIHCVSKSLAAGQGRAESAGQTQVSVLDIAEHLGRTEFGQAIKRVASAQKDKALDELSETLNNMLDEMARRYDGLSGQSSANFRDIARKWSIGLAFVVAIIANVDAPHLLKVLYEDPELSRTIDTEFGDRVEAMSQLEAKLVEEIAAKTQEEAAADDEAAKAAAKEDLEALKAQLEEVKKTFRDTTDELAGLGVPIGWDFFPYCQEVDKLTFFSEDEAQKLQDERCATLARTVYARLKGAERDAGKVALTFSALVDKQKSKNSCNWLGTQVGKFKDRLFGAPKTEEEIKARGASIESWNNASQYICAGSSWLGMRLDHGMTLWIFGVLLGGALIGLGGPFWFDIYSRLSSIAQIARAAGFTTQGKAQKPAEELAHPAVPETAHKPKDVRDAFKNALKVTQQVDSATQQEHAFTTYAALAEAADESNEVPAAVEKPRLPLGSDGGTT